MRASVKELRSGTEAETVAPYNPTQSTAAGADLPALFLNLRLTLKL